MSFAMFGGDAAAKLAALDKSQAIIEFKMDGTIITANQNFLGAMGYTLDEIKGKHHSMFVDPAYRDSADYREFWAALNRGEFQAAQYKRLGKGGKEVWIEASYNPLTKNGKPYQSCGAFRIQGSSTTVRFTVPYTLSHYSGWVVTSVAPGGDEPGQTLMST